MNLSNNSTPNKPIQSLEAVNLSAARLRWMADYTWLELKDGKAYCSDCIKNNPSSEYASGVSNPSNDKLSKHNNSIAHKDAKQKTLNDSKQSKLVSLPKNIEKPSTIIPNNFFPLLKGVLFLAREDLPLFKGESLFELLDDLSVNVLKSYRNNHGCAEILESLSQIAEQDLISRLKRCN